MTSVQILIPKNIWQIELEIVRARKVEVVVIAAAVEIVVL